MSRAKNADEATGCMGRVNSAERLAHARGRLNIYNYANQPSANGGHKLPPRKKMSDTNTNLNSPQMAGCQQEPCSASFVMSFGKYKGRTLDDISDLDPGYVVWLADENVLKIDDEILDAVRCDDMEISTYEDQWRFQYE